MNWLDKVRILVILFVLIMNVVLGLYYHDSFYILVAILFVKLFQIRITYGGDN